MLCVFMLEGVKHTQPTPDVTLEVTAHCTFLLSALPLLLPSQPPWPCASALAQAGTVKTRVKTQKI